MRRWDEFARRRIPAIGGLDAHAPGIRVRSPLPHARTFSLLRTHLLCERPLTGEVASDRAALAWPAAPPGSAAHQWRLHTRRPAMGGAG